MARTKAGFTLIELLVVISIISLLSSVVLSSLNTARDKGRLAAGKTFEAEVYHAEADQAVAAWEFGECSGTAVNDLTGNNNGGNLVGSPSWSTDVPTGAGCSVSLNGSSQYADMGNTAAFDFDNNTSFTLSAWVKPSSVSGYVRIVNNGHAGFTSGWLLQSSSAFGGNGPATGIGGGGSAANSIYFQANTTLPIGKWSHVAAVFDQTNKVARMYIDGQQVGITQYGGTCGTVSGKDLNFTGCSSISAVHTVNTNIGRYAGGSEYFNGLIDRVRIYSKALTAYQLESMYAADAPAFLKPLANAKNRLY